LPLLASAAQLITPLPAAPILSRAQLSALLPNSAAANRSATPAPAKVQDATPALEPNASGIIDLAGMLTAAQCAGDQAEPINPFRLRYHPAYSARTVHLVVSGIVIGSTPDRDCCVLNDQVLRGGETYEGLTVSSISAQRVVLQCAGWTLAVPAGDRAISLRLPQ
jgi:hypothetical protein